MCQQQSLFLGRSGSTWEGEGDPALLREAPHLLGPPLAYPDSTLLGRHSSQLGEQPA